MKEDDIFHPGVTDEQVKRAEELLGGLSLDVFIEKRNSPKKYQSGRLVMPGQAATTIKVLVSNVLQDRPGDRALLAMEVIPNVEYAELVIEGAGQKIRLKGRVEASHPGQRKDDQVRERPLNVALFHEQTE